jgi:hypothetical protein
MTIAPTTSLVSKAGIANAHVMPSTWPGNAASTALPLQMRKVRTIE